MGGTDGEVLDRTRRLLTYLAAVARELTAKPVRDVASHRDAPLIWPGDVPQHARVRLGAGSEGDPWLTVGKVAAPVPPTPPPSLAEHVDQATLVWGRTPALELTAIDDHGDESDREAQEAELRAWVEQVWQPWEALSAADIQARQLYDTLFSLQLRAERLKASHEVIWGHTLCSWRISGTSVVYPLLVTRMVVEADRNDGTLRLAPDGVPELQLQPLEGLSVPTMGELARVAEEVTVDPPDPWAPDAIASVQRLVAAPLGLDVRQESTDTPPAPGDCPVVTDGWVIALRPRPVRHDRFYRQLAELLQDGEPLPQSLAAVVADDDEVRTAVQHFGDPDEHSWRGVGQRLLMPLPANAEQERIVRQLSRERGVTVQGPPGTGKSHTIANLVSHLLAHGMRVLVTAQNEQALSVLRDKIPEELRDLSIAVLGSSAEAMTQLRASAQAVMDLASAVDEDRETGAIAELERSLDDLREQMRRAELEVLDALRSEAAEFPLAEGPRRAPDVARWVSAHERELDRIPDPLRQDQALPLDPQELQELFTLSSTIAPADATALAAYRPQLRDLPTSEDLARLVDAIDRLRQDLADLEQQGLRIDAVDDISEEQLRQHATYAAQVADHVRGIEEPWVLQVREQMRATPEGRHLWTEQTQALTAQLGQAADLQRQVLGHPVEIPEGDPRVQLALLDELRERFSQGKALPRLGRGDLKELHGQITVGGLALRTRQDVDLAHAEIRLRTAIRNLTFVISDLAQHAPLPVPPVGPTALGSAAATIHRLERAVAWETDGYRVASQTLAALLPSRLRSLASHDLTALSELLAHARRRKEERRLSASLQGLIDLLNAGVAAHGASPLWLVLTQSLQTRNWETWTQTLTETGRLSALEAPMVRRDFLANQLAAAAPSWAAAIVSSCADPAAVGNAAQAAQLWHWRQASTWLDELLATGDLARLQGVVSRLQQEEARLVIQLARRGSALGLKRNLKDRNRRALSGWLNALGRIGKGTGKYAAHWGAEARNHLPAAMGAVPVWIMPIHRVIENFDPRVADLFDVVIVDESSQCDLLSVGALALGRKAVVVGDDRQTSPTAVGVDRARIIQLQDGYLPGVPGARLLAADESLYSLAERIFPSTILLREHFRCVPEIIDFSNRYYNREILPLREPSTAAIGAPLRPVHVVDGACTGAGSATKVNRIEAIALADQVVACAKDAAYDGMSFGVVTLLGNAQGPLIEQLLRERLGVEEFQRRRLRVGNPPAFQGDERNVVFVSVVADDHSWAATRKADAQRVNVAASRAQDQLWVFHTVDPTTLHPDDERRALIEYARDAASAPKRRGKLLELCESQFERDVLKALLARGFRVNPQHQVGRYRIDLVVQGTDRRLAVECDGDRFHGLEQWEHDIRRQRQLERLGWAFWRIRASEFYRNPDAALRALYDRLTELDIRPGNVQHGESDGDHVVDARVDAPPAVPPATSVAPRSIPVDVAVEAVAEAPAESAAESAAEAPVAPAVVRSNRRPAPTAGPTSRRPTPAPRVLPIVTPIPTAGAGVVEVRDVEPARSRREAPVVPVPDGYRQVGWIRPHEAAAAAEAYRLSRDVTVVDPEGNNAGVAEYHEANDPDVRKFRARVALHRTSGTRTRVVAWLREHEAKAILAAARYREDVVIEPSRTQQGVLVQYHAEGSPEARTYRSSTRLHRRKPG